MKDKDELDSQTTALDLQSLVDAIPSGDYAWYTISPFSLEQDGLRPGDSQIILPRLSKSGLSWRYDLVDFKRSLGAGSYGLVFEVVTTFKVDEKGLHYRIKSAEKKRVAKFEKMRSARPVDEQLQYFCDFADIRAAVQEYTENRKKFMNEFYLTQLVGYMCVKDPVFLDVMAYCNQKGLQLKTGYYGALVLRHIEGDTMADVFEKDNDEPLTLAERFDTTKAILRGALAVHGAGILHRDVKPANVILSKDRKKATSIDFGLSKKMNECVKTEDVGTIPFMAPEILRYVIEFRKFINDPHHAEPLMPFQTPACDAYSDGRLLFVLWKGNLRKKFPPRGNAQYQDVEFCHAIAQQEDFSELFIGINELNSRAKEKLKEVIVGLSKYDAKKRMTLERALELAEEAERIQFHELASSPGIASEASVLSKSSPRGFDTGSSSSSKSSPRSENESPIPRRKRGLSWFLYQLRHPRQLLGSKNQSDPPETDQMPKF